MTIPSNDKRTGTREYIYTEKIKSEEMGKKKCIRPKIFTMSILSAEALLTPNLGEQSLAKLFADTDLFPDKIQMTVVQPFIVCP